MSETSTFSSVIAVGKGLCPKQNYMLGCKYAPSFCTVTDWNHRSALSPRLDLPRFWLGCKM